MSNESRSRTTTTLGDERKEFFQSWAQAQANLRLLRQGIYGMWCCLQNDNLDPRDVFSAYHLAGEYISWMDRYQQELADVMGNIPDASAGDDDQQVH